MCVHMCVRVSALCVPCVVLPPSPASRPHELAAQTQATPGSPSEPLSMPGTTGWGRQVGGGSGPGPRLGRGLGDARSGACTAVTRVRGNRSWRRAPWVTAVRLGPRRRGCWTRLVPGLTGKAWPEAGTPAGPGGPLPTHVHQEGQPGHPLHGEDQEGDHGQAAARGPLLNLAEDVPEGGIAASAAETRRALGCGLGGAAHAEPAPSRPPPRDPGPAHVSRCRARCW